MKDKIDILSDELNKLLDMPYTPHSFQCICDKRMELELARQEKATTVPLKNEILAGGDQ